MMVTLVPLTGGMVAVIDDADAPTILAHKWRAAPSPRKGGPPCWYAARTVNRDGGGTTTEYMHRRIAGAKKGAKVDHKDRDTLNNRRANLRGATDSQNCCNRENEVGVSGYRGVYPTRNGRPFYASIQFEGRVYYLGRYRTAEEAALTYDAKAAELHGDFALLNFPTHAEAA